MTIGMDGSFMVPADKVTVWEKLNDPEVLRACITGCQRMEKKDETSFAATFKVKFGLVSVSIKGRIDLRDVDAPNGCRILGAGEGGIAGFAKGVAVVTLAQVSEGTIVTYSVEANLGGKIAHLGGRIVDGLGQKMADRFFTAFSAAVALKTAAAE